jgi:hypothetical protein
MTLFVGMVWEKYQLFSTGETVRLLCSIGFHLPSPGQHWGRRGQALHILYLLGVTKVLIEVLFDLWSLYSLTSAAIRRIFLRPLWIVTRSVRTVPTAAVTLVSYKNRDSSLGSEKIYL